MIIKTTRHGWCFHKKTGALMRRLQFKTYFYLAVQISGYCQLPESL